MLQQSNKGIFISIKVIPKSSRHTIVGWENEELKIRLAALPDKGEANAALICFLADFFDISQSQIELVAGQKSRHKRICLKDISLIEVRNKLKNYQ